jgi:PAS domain S-box-containing protein
MVRASGTPPTTKSDDRASPVRIAGIYLLFSLIWIWGSDLALIRAGVQGEPGFWAGALKGSAFVFLSAGILYLLIGREVRALTRALDLLRAVADGTTDAVFVKDRDGKYLLFNEAAARFVGKPVAEVLGKDDTELFDAPSAALVMARDREVMESGRVGTHEEALTAAGVTRVYMATKAPYRDASGRVMGLVGISRDVTDRKLAESALRTSEERYRALVELAPDAIVTVRDGRIVFANAAAARITAAPSAAALVGVPVNDHIHPDDLSASAGRQEKILQRGEFVPPHEMRVRRLDGAYIDVETCSGPCTIDGARGIQLVARDVTERKRGAAFLARQTAILERIAARAPLPEVLDEIVRMLEEQLPGAVGSILLLDRAGRCLRHGAAPNLPPAYSAAVDGVVIGPRVGSCGTAAFTRGPVLVNDIATDPLWTDYKDLALAHGLRTCWSTPIFAAQRGAQPDVLGTFAVYGRAPGAPDPRFAELVARAEHVASIAIESDRAARDLRESEGRYRALVESSADAIFVNEGGRITYANPALLRIIGADAPEQVIGKTPFDILHPDDHARAGARIRMLHETREPLPFVEFRFLKRDGTPVDVEVSGAPFEQRGALAVHVTARDISERKRAERVLREREEQLRTFVDHVWAPIAMLDRDMRYIHISRRWLTDYRLGDRNVIGLSHYEVFPEIPERWRAAHRRCLAGAVERCEEDRFERADGSVQWLRWEIQPWRQADGMVGGIAMFTEDITARKRMEAQLQQTQKLEAVGRLAGGIAHDFNNLLTVINGFSDFVLRALAPTDPHRDALLHIREAGQRAARLTQQLLAYGRKALLEPKVLDLNELVTESVRLLRRLIGEDVTVATALSPALDRIKADRGQIEQVLMNLVVNARDAMPSGGTITVETRNVPLRREELPDDPDLVPGQYVRLTVTDTGTGMTDEVKAKLFEPFFTTKEQGKGTGLGLAVVQGAIKQSGGHIGVTSAIGAGTTFTVLFPAVEADLPLSALLKRPARGTETILLVEDEDAVRAIARRGLEREGYTVLTAAGGPEALTTVADRARPIDLLVTDVVMPQMGGRQLAETLRARQPGLRVLFMSGYIDDVVLRHGLAEASGDFLQKPFTALELARKVREILDREE